MLPDVSFHVIGISHHTAAIELRERLAFSAAEAEAWLQGQAAAGSTALILTTCNRSEFYWSGDHDLEAWFRDFASGRGAGIDEAFLRLDGEDAVRHLFEVAAGLNSQILGETEVLGQVRRAYDAARAAGTTDRTMDAVFSAALIAGRRVRRETMLGRHPASVSSAAVDVAATARGTLADARVLVLGAGEVAEGVLKSLHGRTRQTTLVNRRPERAAALASAWDAASGAWEELDGVLAKADVVFVATSAGQPVISASRVAQSLGQARQVTVFDLSVPRNVDPAARDLPGMRLFDLDDLQRMRCPVDGFSSPAIDHARSVLEQEIQRLDGSLRARAAAPHLAELHRMASQMAEEEAGAALAQLSALGERERKVVREMAERLVRRVLYPVSRSVREGGPVGDGAKPRD